MNMTKRLTTLLLTLILCLTLTIGAMPSYGEALKNSYVDKEDLNFFLEVIDYVKERYPFEVKDEELITNAVKGVLQGLDPYSNYYAKEEAIDLMETLNGSYVGIGAYLGETNGYIEVISTFANSPAEKAGLKAGDLIVSVDDLDVKGLTLDEAVKLIKGKEGTKVKIGVLREGKQIYFEITRQSIEINPVSYKILEKDIGYIKLDEFSTNATKYVKEALSEFDNKGIKKVILDLRDNPGGLLDEAISLSRLFIPKGPIVHIRRNFMPIETRYSYLEKPKYELVVLVNGNSASASEIFAGAVKDRKAGTLIGTKTFGKGLIQSIMPLNDGSILKMTTAEYLTPNETSINGIGIEPDIAVENTTHEDLQLKKAIETLNN